MYLSKCLTGTWLIHQGTNVFSQSCLRCMGRRTNQEWFLTKHLNFSINRCGPEYPFTFIYCFHSFVYLEKASTELRLCMKRVRIPTTCAPTTDPLPVPGLDQDGLGNNYPSTCACVILGARTIEMPRYRRVIASNIEPQRAQTDHIRSLGHTRSSHRVVLVLFDSGPAGGTLFAYLYFYFIRYILSFTVCFLGDVMKPQ
jgi:hypothetical protein